MLQSLSTVFSVSVVAGNLTEVKKCEIYRAFEGHESLQLASVRTGWELVPWVTSFGGPMGVSASDTLDLASLLGEPNSSPLKIGSSQVVVA